MWKRWFCIVGQTRRYCVRHRVFIPAVDVNSENPTALIKIAQPLLRGRQCIHSIHSNDDEVPIFRWQVSRNTHAFCHYHRHHKFFLLFSFLSVAMNERLGPSLLCVLRIRCVSSNMPQTFLKVRLYSGRIIKLWWFRGSLFLSHSKGPCFESHSA